MSNVPELNPLELDPAAYDSTDGVDPAAPSALNPNAEFPWSPADSQELTLELWGLQGEYTFRWEVPAADSVRALIEHQPRPAPHQATVDAATLTPDGRAALGEWLANTRDAFGHEIRDVHLATYFFNPESNRVEGRPIEAGDLEAEAISVHLSDMVDGWFMAQIDQRWHDEQRIRDDRLEEERQARAEAQLATTSGLEAAAPWRQGLSRLESDLMEADGDARAEPQASRANAFGLGG